MRDYYFFTKTKVTLEDCLAPLQKEIACVRKHGGSNIKIDAKSRSYLWLYNDRIEDYDEDEIEDLKSRIPIVDPYITFFETHRSIDAKRVIKVLMQLYPELYINVNDESDWYGTAQEYLDTEFYY